MKYKYTYILMSLLLSGCFQQIAIKSVSNILYDGFAVINEEQDLEIAEKSIASNLKLLEALLRSEPNNEQLLLLASIGYTSYSLGFVEDENPERARIFYTRGRDYGMELLEQRRQFKKLLNKNIDEFRSALKNFTEEDIPALFWTGTAWGSYILLDLSDPAGLADLPKVEAIMEFIVEKEPSYYYGGAHMFLGTLLASKPKMFGGDLDKSKIHFDKCIEINEGKFLMAWYYFAKSYSVQKQDINLFRKCLEQVETTSLDALPEVRLANAIAKKKASMLQSKIEDYF